MESTLYALLTLAAFIVIKLEHLTSGVTVELDAVAKCKREDGAVVILPGGDRDGATGMSSEMFKGFALAVPETELQSPEITAKLQVLISKALEHR